MKFTSAVIFTFALIILSPLLACGCDDSPSAPVLTNEVLIKNVSLKYPEGWRDQTQVFADYIAANLAISQADVEIGAWSNDTESILLFFGTSDAPPNATNIQMSEDEKERFVIEMTPGSLDFLAVNPEIIEQRSTTVAGEWAWEIEFRGYKRGDDVTGYELLFLSNTAIRFLCCVEYGDPTDDLALIYQAVRESIVIH